MSNHESKGLLDSLRKWAERDSDDGGDPHRSASPESAASFLVLAGAVIAFILYQLVFVGGLSEPIRVDVKEPIQYAEYAPGMPEGTYVQLEMASLGNVYVLMGDMTGGSVGAQSDLLHYRLYAYVCCKSAEGDDVVLALERSSHLFVRAGEQVPDSSDPACHRAGLEFAADVMALLYTGATPGSFGGRLLGVVDSSASDGVSDGDAASMQGVSLLEGKSVVAVLGPDGSEIAGLEPKAARALARLRLRDGDVVDLYGLDGKEAPHERVVGSTWEQEIQAGRVVSAIVLAGCLVGIVAALRHVMGNQHRKGADELTQGQQSKPGRRRAHRDTGHTTDRGRDSHSLVDGRQNLADVISTEDVGTGVAETRGAPDDSTEDSLTEGSLTGDLAGLWPEGSEVSELFGENEAPGEASLMGDLNVADAPLFDEDEPLSDELRQASGPFDGHHRLVPADVPEDFQLAGDVWIEGVEVSVMFYRYPSDSSRRASGRLARFDLGEWLGATEGRFELGLLRERIKGDPFFDEPDRDVVYRVFDRPEFDDLLAYLDGKIELRGPFSQRMVLASSGEWQEAYCLHGKSRFIITRGEQGIYVVMIDTDPELERELDESLTGLGGEGR